MDPWTQEWFDRLQDEVLNGNHNGGSYEHACYRLDWVKANHKTSDTNLIRNNIGKGLAVLGIRTPVGFF